MNLNPGEITPELIVKTIRERNTKFIRYLYIDLDNVIRGRVSMAENIEADLRGGLTLAVIMQSGFSVLDLVVAGTMYGPRGEVSLIPDISTFRILPYVESTAAMIVEQYVGDRPHEVDPRPRLRGYLDNLRYKFRIGLEPEFYILRKSSSGEVELYEKHRCFSTEGMNTVHPIISEVVHALEHQGIYVDHYYPEYGAGQHELSLKPETPIRAADNFIYFRETMRGVLGKHGLYASFMPKPSEDLPGSGLHIHISMWGDDVNLFYDEDDVYLLSSEAYHFIGGVLKHLKEIIAFTASSVNSYKRLRPNSWASAFACYGPENREAAIRIARPARGREAQSTRLEMKFVDATANPYLAIGSIIAAGVDGIMKKIDPGEPCLDNPSSYLERNREEKNWYRYPETLLDAIRELDRSTLMREVWGDTLVSEYVKLKKFQWDQYYYRVTDWERKMFLDAY
ncbi:MAG: glutamine synthetase family protein [Ignisphaera sp.]|nr:glutamine synthetase family protein [Ignisphaera sp.]MDW8085388.1 glutamine synthetase family protein [Ignisphaera sp.]